MYVCSQDKPNWRDCYYYRPQACSTFFMAALDNLLLFITQLNEYQINNPCMGGAGQMKGYDDIEWGREYQGLIGSAVDQIGAKEISSWSLLSLPTKYYN